jgi:DNA-binding NtrC family response regulator
MNLLIVDDEQSIRETCTAVAQQLDLRVTAVSTAEEAAELLEYAPVDILLTDLQLPGTGGLALLKRVRDRYPEIALMVLTQYGTIDSAVEATRLGAVDYVTKPFRIEELKTRLERAAHSVDLQRENQLLREQLRTRPGFGGLIGLSPKMESVYKVIGKVSQHDYPVLILGESGTGKELVEPAQGTSLCSGGLFLADAYADRIGIIRLRKGRVYRRIAIEARPARIGAWRHAVSG